MHSGFDDLMPLERGFPRFIPRFFGTKLKIIIGPSITSKVTPLIEEYHSIAGGARSSFNNSNNSVGIKDIVGRRPKPPNYEGESKESKRIRIEIAALLKEEVEKLGRKSRQEGKARGLKLGNEVTSD